MKKCLILVGACLLHGYAIAQSFDDTYNTDDANPPMNVTFKIPAGTGSGAWNTAQTPIVACGNPAQATITYVNDDTVAHRVHTNGKPHPHMGPTLAPGQSNTVTINVAAFDNTQPGSTNEVYDHNFGAATSRIYIKLVACPTEE